MSDALDDAILVFPFRDAPSALQHLSSSCDGNEEWIVVQRGLADNVTPIEIGSEYPATLLVGSLGNYYHDEDSTCEIVEWNGSRCAVWIFAH